MELVSYIRLFRKWFWLLFLGAFLSGGAAFLRASSQVDQYEASVMVQIGLAPELPNPDTGDISTSASLAKTYVVLAKSYDVLEATVEAGNFNISPTALRAIVDVDVIPETPIMTMTVIYTDPVQAADMANELARQLILNNPSNLPEDQQAMVDLQQLEVERLEQELLSARLDVTNIDSQLALITDEAEIERLTEQRNALMARINQTSANIASYTATLATLQQRSTAMKIIEQARPQYVPVGRDRFSQTVLGAVIGMALAGGVALLIEYLDDTVRSPQEASQLLSVPTLAAITRFGKVRDDYRQRLVTYRNPGSPMAEEYRTLRTNLLFSANGNTDKGAFILTSPGPAEGKTITAANLAVTMAMAGWRVLLIDADLRRPRMHDIFDLNNNIGLSTLLSVNPGDFMNGDDHILRGLDECIQATDIPGLSVLTSGHIPLNPTEVLGSASMQRWYQEFRARDDIDIILFDTPPALVVADSAVLASAVDVPVVLVIEAKGTRRSAALNAKEQFDQLDVPVTGVVLNAVNPRDRSEFGYGYNYYYYYYSDSGSRANVAD